MPRIGKAQRALNRAHDHRDAIERLIADSRSCRGFFLDWAESELRRNRFHWYSKKEYEFLAREINFHMELMSGFGGMAVPELIREAGRYTADCSLSDEEFIKYLEAEQPVEIPRWQLKRLVRICKTIAGVDLPPTDELYDDVDRSVELDS